MCTLIKTSIAEIANIHEKVVVAGRILRLRIVLKDFVIIHWNAHNFDLDNECMKQFVRLLEHDKGWATSDPCRRGVIVSGDFNFVGQDDCRMN